MLSLCLFVPQKAVAEEGDDLPHGETYYYDTAFNAGKDDGYAYDNPIKKDDPHYGWKLGRFVVYGFTDRKGDENTPIFLKNAGDEVTLTFELQQDLNALDGDERLKVVNDKNGYDQKYQVKKQDFGRGALIVKQTDYHNASDAPKVYADYLKGVKKGADTKLVLFEEGDYEVSLDYVVESPGMLPFKPAQHDYHVHFKFKIRNGNTMVFLKDLKTGGELISGSVTPSGFKVDFAQSHYLDVSVKRELLNDSRDELVEDTRFNRVIADGDEFAEPGIYTITARNQAAGDETTVKKIYVGDDELLKASVANGISIAEAQELLDDGAEFAEDGTLIQTSAPNSSEAEQAGQVTGNEEDSESGSGLFSVRPIFIVLFVLAVVYAGLRAFRGGEKK
jgi:hypothetical protein